jgi:hypothetical protein
VKAINETSGPTKDGGNFLTKNILRSGVVISYETLDLKINSQNSKEIFPSFTDLMKLYEMKRKTLHGSAGRDHREFTPPKTTQYTVNSTFSLNYKMQP